MADYILKSALVAEIESKRKYAQTLGDNAINSSMQQFYDGMKQGCVNILSFINTFEVKEVDLEKEFDKYTKDISAQDIKEEPFTQLFECAKHFFELGLNASNPLTWEDIKLILTIGNEIPFMPEEDFFKELLKRFKAQKGEKV